MIIPINASNGSYDIVLERGALKNISKYIKTSSKALVVTDDGVPSEYAKAVADQLGNAIIATIPHGESSKSFENYMKLLGVLTENSFSRSDCVIAVGGGVVGDLSGFVASTFMRGIDFYNIPTTFLSQVDSSVGGKVAVDMCGVKNIVGAFYQPKKVIIDPNVLSTLDERQLKAGLVESVKMAATCSAELFGLIESSTDFEKDCEKIIEHSLRIKKYVVEEDPKESGLRRVLNFGHTIGHAVESSKMGEYLHGECVGIGMIPMSFDSARDRIESVLKKYGLPTKVDVDREQLMHYMMLDKKKSGNSITIVLVNEIGSFEFKKVSRTEIRDYLERMN